MKKINTLLSSVLLVAAVSPASAASVEHQVVVMEKMPRTPVISRHAVFRTIVSNHVDRAIERHLDYQADLVMAEMYEAPTAVSPMEIEIERQL